MSRMPDIYMILIVIASILIGCLIGAEVQYHMKKPDERILGTFTIDESVEAEAMFSLKFDKDPMELADGETIMLKVTRK